MLVTRVLMNLLSEIAPDVYGRLVVFERETKAIYIQALIILY